MMAGMAVKMQGIRMIIQIAWSDAPAQAEVQGGE